ARTSFVLDIPLNLKFPLDPSEFTVEAITDIQGEFPSAKGTLEIFPPGIVEFDCPAKQQRIPNRWFSLFRCPPAVYPIDLKNTSNSPQRVRLSSTQAEPLNLQLLLPFLSIQRKNNL
ncbi:MAG: hypothetical protein HC769_37495, partial [Cyanobacteria bacterium CRU_2_1]|nr:hypothetical protein [Cyanobacteria bacterium CRU_2_1]